MSMFLMMLAMAGANAAPQDKDVQAAPPVERVCRQLTALDGRTTRRKVCATPAEWAAFDRRRPNLGMEGRSPFPSLNPGPGDSNGRTASRPVTVR